MIESQAQAQAASAAAAASFQSSLLQLAVDRPKNDFSMELFREVLNAKNKGPEYDRGLERGLEIAKEIRVAGGSAPERGDAGEDGFDIMGLVQSFLMAKMATPPAAAATAPQPQPAPQAPPPETQPEPAPAPPPFVPPMPYPYPYPIPPGWEAWAYAQAMAMQPPMPGWSPPPVAAPQVPSVGNGFPPAPPPPGYPYPYPFPHPPPAPAAVPVAQPVYSPAPVAQGAPINPHPVPTPVQPVPQHVSPFYGHPNAQSPPFTPFPAPVAKPPQPPSPAASLANPADDPAGSVISPSELVRLIGEATESSSSTDEFIGKLKKLVPQ
ncbi:hypothetical protein [Polyangium sp. y55x31]|uniref:hypothetical protein n=1 Tax=Polyangium sp. y55x31 TaxID=3042688 RepID=UPI002482C881|nr:hypothetical protein [Polyangium sp. y55x31]MDI1480403.1 hypothetical protein [Polyangium sp. y55x31]